MNQSVRRSYDVSSFGTRVPNPTHGASLSTVFGSRINGATALLLFPALLFLNVLLTGCGASYTVRGSSNSSSSSTGTIAASPDSVDFGAVSVGQSANTKVVVTNQGNQAVQVSQLSVAGSNFSIDGQGNLPVTIAAGSTLSFQVHFKPQTDTTSTGTVSITSNSEITPTASVKLHGVGKKATAAASNNTLTCSKASFTGAATDSCTVYLGAANAFNVTNVSLSSSSLAVTVPATVTIPVNATSANFTANVAAVNAPQAVTLTADVNGADTTFLLQLNADAPALTLSTSSLSFGSQTVNQKTQKSVTLTSAGAAPLTISSASISGSGFTMSGLALPLSLAPGKSATVNVQFDPTAAGTDSGQLSIVSNSASNPTAVISLSGTGTTSNALSAIACSQASMTGAGTDPCTVTLSTPAGSGGVGVSLSSNDSAVSIPASVTVPAGATGVGFTAAVSAVTSAQTATLAASTGSATRSFALQLNATTPTLQVSTTSVNFGNVTVGQTVQQSITLSSTGNGPVTISGLSVAGSLFSASGVAIPATLNPGQSATVTLQFHAPGTSQYTGALTVYSNSSTGNIIVNMSAQGTAAPGALSGLTCISGSMSAAGTDGCTVMLSAPAGSSGLVVNLASSSTAVSVPGSVTVPANASSASFNATVSSVSSTQAATLTATSGGTTQSFVIQLNAGGTSTLSINATSISFGNVVLNTPATQTVTLTSSGTAAVTVNSASVGGSGFTITGMTFPVTLNPGQTATLNVQFDPTTTGTASGQLTIVSTSSTNPTVVITLGGTGEPHIVNLTWNAPTSTTDPVAGYNVYRSPDGGATYQQIGSTNSAQTSYSDNTVAGGQAYDYVVKSFDASGNESAPSNMTSVTVP